MISAPRDILDNTAGSIKASTTIHIDWVQSKVVMLHQAPLRPPPPGLEHLGRMPLRGTGPGL